MHQRRACNRVARERSFARPKGVADPVVGPVWRTLGFAFVVVQVHFVGARHRDRFGCQVAFPGTEPAVEHALLAQAAGADALLACRRLSVVHAVKRRLDLLAHRLVGRVQHEAKPLGHRAGMFLREARAGCSVDDAVAGAPGAVDAEPALRPPHASGRERLGDVAPPALRAHDLCACGVRHGRARFRVGNEAVAAARFQGGRRVGVVCPHAISEILVGLCFPKRERQVFRRRVAAPRRSALPRVDQVVLCRAPRRGASQVHVPVSVGLQQALGTHVTRGACVAGAPFVFLADGGVPQAYPPVLFGSHRDEPKPDARGGPGAPPLVQVLAVAALATRARICPCVAAFEAVPVVRARVHRRRG